MLGPVFALRFHMRRARAMTLVLALGLALVVSMAGMNGAGAVTVADGPGTPSISSDQADYAPGSTVVLTGLGWQPGEAVHLDVNDDLGRTWEYTNDVTADDQGTVTDTFTLPDWFVATYRVDATGALSGTVTTTFTDGNVKLGAAVIGAPNVTINPTQSASTFTGSTTCSGTGTPANNLNSISSGAGDSVLARTTSPVTSGGTTYDFDHWGYGTNANPALDPTNPPYNGDPLSTCATGFDKGTHNLTALYVARSTTTVLTSSAAPSVYGDALTLTATVSSTAGVPTSGTVAFRDGAATITGCDTVSLSGAGTATCSFTALAQRTLAVGSHNLTAVYTSGGAYPTSTGNLTQVVNKRPLTASFTANDKLYDGTTAATIASRSLLGGIVGTDAVSLNGGTATFASKDVGQNKTVTGSGFSLGGGDNGKYILGTGSVTTTANIGTKPLTVSFTAADKVYDGTTSATITGRTLSGVVGQDSVSVAGGTATFGTKNVGNGKTVSASGFTLGGTDASDYAVTTVNTTTASVTAKPITGTFTAQDKTYDGTTSATIATRGLNGAVQGDDVSLNGGTAQFAGKNVGSGISVSGTGFTLTGSDGGNYTLTSVGTTTAAITPKHVTGAFTASAKIYDGTRAATVATTSLPGKVAGDTVSFQGTAQFADPHAGTAKTVSFVGGSLAGSDAGNYVLDGVADTSADISPKALTGGFTAADKPYDGTTAATIIGRQLNGVVGNDAVTLTGGTATFGTRHVGSGITVTGTGFALSGAAKDDYALASSTLTTSANITKLSVVGHVTVDNKVYDGTTGATITGESVTGTVGTDAVTLTGGTATFGTKDVGTHKTVTLTGASLGGADAGDYALQNPTPTTQADITPLAISGSFATANKVYDGTTDAAAHDRALSGVVTGDDVTLTGGTAAFGNKNVGTGKFVTLTGATLGGTDAGNYTLTGVDPANADISALAISGSFKSDTKVYDGTTTASAHDRALSGVVTGDDVSLTGGTAAFGNTNVGTGKSVILTGATLGGADAGNYTLASVADAKADITPLSITGSFTAQDKVYDGNLSAIFTGPAVSGVIAGDSVTLAGGTATFADKNVGTGKSVTLTGATLGGTDAGNYTLSSIATGKASITRRAIAGAFTSDNRVYDGTRAATAHDRALFGVVTGDDVSLTGGTATFDTKDAGTGKTVTLTGAGLSGTDAGNYALDSVADTKADITALAITGTFTAGDKTYDGTTDATVTGRELVGTVNGDHVSLTSGTASFDTKDVGAHKVVALTGATLAGTDAGNYTLTSVADTKADITAKHITGTFTAGDKTYDATTDATVTGRDLVGTIDGDHVSLTGGIATFGSKNVGTGKSVTLTGATLDGSDAGDYILDSVADTKADITFRSVTGSFGVANKVYDGNDSATVTQRSVSGQVSGDDVTLTGGTAAFADKNVGTGKAVAFTGATLGGTDAGNYTLSSVADAQADITPLSITGSFATDSKVYDGTRAAAAHDRALTGTVTGDDVSLTGGTAAFGNKNVGTGKTVALTGATLGGADAGNYTLSGVDTSTADITPLAITGSFKSDAKVYDGTVSAAGHDRALTGTVSGDDVTLTGGTATFDTRDVGTGKTVTLTGATLDGTDAGNYTLTAVADTKADITAKHITGTFTVGNKVYDGNDSATVTQRSVSGQVSGDDVTLTGGTAAFADKNVGAGKAVTLTGAGLSGTDAGNYVLDSVADAQADITARHITGSFATDSKVYDGTVSAAAHDRALTGTVTGDDVSLTGGTAAFGNKDVGTGKAVTLTGAGLSGADAGNYTLDSVADANADITALAITGSFATANKVYDGTVSAAAHDRALTGTVTGDDVSLTGGTATFDTKDVGTGKTVTLTGATLGGADAGDYTLTGVDTAKADITAKHVTGTFTAGDKTYDGTTDATVTGRDLTGTIDGDHVSLTGGTATFGTKDVGSGKAVTLTGATLGGTDAGNYILDSVADTKADITAKHITGTFTAGDKTYDGTTDATVTGRDLTGTIDGDHVSLTGGTAAFGNKNVGPGKAVTLSGATLGGADAGNYTLDSVADAKADITALAITGTFKTDSKVYNGTRAAAAHDRALLGTVTGDDVSLTGGTATFDTKTVGTGKTVTLTGATLTGTDAGNYTLTSVADTKADITPLAITGSFTANGKVYDGQVSDGFTNPALTGVLTGDSVTLAGGTATFADKNVGTNKTVTLTGATLGGTDAGNYTLTSVAPSTASITPAALTVTADDKTMQMGATLPPLTGKIVGAAAGDTITASYTTTATPSSTGGFYPIVPSLAGTSAGVLANYNVQLIAGKMTVTFVWNGFLQPVNDTAHQQLAESQFKLGQTIPLKFDLATVTGTTVLQTGNPAFSVGNYRATCNSDVVSDTVPSVAADPSSVYAYTGGHYQYNWSTKSVTKPGEYRVYAALADGTKPWVDICLR